LCEIEREIVARICNDYVSYSSVLHATSSRVRAKHPPLGVNVRPAPAYMPSENYVKISGG